jgi:phenylacetate-CoA ligase
MDEQVFSLLKNQIKKLYRTSFYKNKLDQQRVLPEDVRSAEDFFSLPFTTSSEILEELQNPPERCSLYSKDVVRINFSPSGKTLYPVYHTASDLEYMHRVCNRTLADAGVHKDDVCSVTFGYHLFVAGLFYQSQIEAYGAKVIPLGPGETDRAVKLINDYGITVLISNPTFAMKLASAGIPGVRILFVGGEPFTSVAGYADKVRQAFGRDITIIDSYSMALCLPIARSCRFDTGLHLMDEFVYAEVIDPDTGKNLPCGEKGELVLTHLKKEAAPLLRYRTGDLTIMMESACGCGRRMTLPRSVFGRTDEMLKIKGVKFWPSQVGTILREFSDLTGKYRIFVKEEDGVDVLALKAEKRISADPPGEGLGRRLKQETLLAFNRIDIVDALEEGPTIVDERKGRVF